MDPNAKQQILERLQQANNVLVTVSANPSVDQLSACIGLTLLLNKLGKHGTAVFSGDIPSTIEFLKPEETIEKNTDSLRDFIIALDKSKADKLRYKVEDKIVKIFITPYRTSLSEKDLDFSQGDFNVDVVMGLGVHERTDLDKAIMAHGRILHDATVISVNNRDQGNVGAINWVDLNASSLSEMLVDLSKGLTTEPMDAQMATAFMTGIVAETDRFSNDRTSPATMTLASELMSAGANQQLIASKLEGTKPIPKVKPADTDTTEDDADDDGSLRISHDDAETAPPASLPPVVEDNEEENSAPAGPKISKLRNDEQSSKPPTQPEDAAPPKLSGDSNMVLEPPALGSKLTANSEPEHAQVEPSTDPLSTNPAADQPLLNRLPLEAAAPATMADGSPATLNKIEESVDSPHVSEEAGASAAVTDNPKNHLEEAREAVDAAIGGIDPVDQPLEPIEALGAQPVNLDLHTGQTAPPMPAGSPPVAGTPPAFMPPAVPMPAPQAPPANGVNPNIPSQLMPTTPLTDTTAAASAPAPPPPVPPPMMPPPAP